MVERNVNHGQTVAASLSAPQLFLIANDLTQMQILAQVGELRPDLLALAQRRREEVDVEFLHEEIPAAFERANEGERPYLIALSLGVACERANDATTLDGLVAQADAALYADKRSRPADRQWQR